MAETQVQLPWMDEPIPLEEAVEAVAQVSNEDADDTEMLADRVEELSDRMTELDDRVATLADGAEATGEESGVSERIETLERCVEGSNDATDVECPSCEEGDDVLKSGVAAAVLVRRDALSDKNVQALNQESHLCLSCKKAFTPCEIAANG